VNRTRISLLYLASYLVVIGLGLLLVPAQTLRLLLSNGAYGDTMPRLAGMLMAGLGLTIAGIMRAQAQALYPATLFVRVFFVASLIAIYAVARDPFFLTITVIVLVGMGLTFSSYLIDRSTLR
jgi:hypothetical protein